MAGWVVAAVLGTGRTLLLPLVGAALSMWLGLVLRRREPLGTGTRFALGVGNALAVVLLLPMLASYTSGGRPDFSDEASRWRQGYPSQVVANGEPVQNLYAYDAAGNRLEGVRIFDQSGRALFVGLESLMGGSDGDVPIRPDDGSAGRQRGRLPLTWPGHDAWQDPGFGWTPPLTLPPLAGATGPGAVPTDSPSGSDQPVPERVRRPRARRTLSPESGAPAAAGDHLSTRRAVRHGIQ